ncbi:MAG: hypothetical protein ACOY46_02485 [Bacillota bacterium]
MKRITVGIAGTAKNTGKTTTTRVLLEHFQNRGVRLGITSIGYDGEKVDNITGLPKPRIFLNKGDFAAVAEKCLGVSSARMKIIARTDINTPLGRIVCGEVMKEGLMVVAGPNQSVHLRSIRQWMYGQETGLVIVDGALNRIAPMVETDGFILATGAAHTVDLDRLAFETHCIGVICNHPGVYAIPHPGRESGNTIVWDGNGQVLAKLPAFLFDPGDLGPFLEVMAKARCFFCPGVISGACLNYMWDLGFAEGTSFVFEDPVKLLLSDVTSAHRFIEKVFMKGGSVGYIRALPLIAVTVNPFYPSCRYGTHSYQEDYVDRDLLLGKIKSAVEVPVFDVVSQGPEELAALLERYALSIENDVCINI